MKATEQLRAEHQGILKMLQILAAICTRIDSGQPANLDHMEKIIEFLQVFADRCHHGKEETILFPALERAGIPREGGPIGVMLGEHTHGRNYIAAMKAATAKLKAGDETGSGEFAEAARGYIGLLQNHIAKEDNVLFAMADKSLQQAQQGELYEDFERLERDEIGAGRHEAFHRLIDELAELYLK